MWGTLSYYYKIFFKKRLKLNFFLGAQNDISRAASTKALEEAAL